MHAPTFTLAKTGFALAAAGLAATPALAQPRPIDTITLNEPVEQINMQSVAPALAVVTGNQVETFDASGAPIILATATNGLRFEVHFRYCDDEAADAEPAAKGAGTPHCKALYMMSVWDPVPSASSDQFDTTVAPYLRDHPMVNVSRHDDGKPYVVRYVIADYGSTQGNLASEFANFIRSATAFQNTIAPLYVGG